MATRTCITLFRTFLCRFCTTTTRNCLILYLMEDAKRDDELLFLCERFEPRSHFKGRLSLIVRGT